MNGLSNSPFPGMNPWLEHPSLWGDVHFRLIAALANYLSPLLVPHYYVAVGTHTYVTTLPNTPSIRYPDVAVVETKAGGIVHTPATLHESAVAEPVMVEVPLADTVEESYLEIREPLSGDVITAIELLSPLNKRPGSGRDKYLRKRLEIFTTYTHLVEIDLLRSWPPMPFAGSSPLTDYRILLRRGEEGARARLYPFNLAAPIPCFPLPLQAGDDEPIVDLNQLLQQIYREASYHLRLDYTKLPVPPLQEEEQKWAEQILQAARAL
ncbi:MAG: DUF4058 family protein [Caldilineaceae bacterium]